ncbi:MAG TPA: GMC oxidoreductase [Kofleriaceae bacterium]|nr:GMC oxidoreductase [Kofleriaceae bacterium]
MLALIETIAASVALGACKQRGRAPASRHDDAATSSVPSTAPTSTLDARSFRALEAATARILPGDASFAGAREAHVMTFIERQLAIEPYIRLAPRPRGALRRRLDLVLRRRRHGPHDALPLAPIAQHPIAALMAQACERYGTPSFQPPRAILSAAYRGRAACHYCGFCAGYGCEVGAKSSTAASLLREAATTGKLTLRPRAQVLRIEADATGRARAVVWRDETAVRTEDGAIIWYLPGVNPNHDTEEAAKQRDQPPLWGAALTARLKARFLESRRLVCETFADFVPHRGCFALGMTGSDVTSVTRDGFYWYLQAGTARMARTDADGVVGPDGQAFEHPGLYVADGAALPSTGGAPFTLTITANALRIAQKLAAT